MPTFELTDEEVGRIADAVVKRMAAAAAAKAAAKGDAAAKPAEKKPTEQKPKEAQKPAEKPKPKDELAEDGPTKDDVLAKLKEYRAATSPEDMLKVLKKFAPTFAELKPEDYKAVIDAVDEATSGGV